MDTQPASGSRTKLIVGIILQILGIVLLYVRIPLLSETVYELVSPTLGFVLFYAGALIAPSNLVSPIVALILFILTVATFYLEFMFYAVAPAKSLFINSLLGQTGSLYLNLYKASLLIGAFALFFRHFKFKEWIVVLGVAILCFGAFVTNSAIGSSTSYSASEESTIYYLYTGQLTGTLELYQELYGKYPTSLADVTKKNTYDAVLGSQEEYFNASTIFTGGPNVQNYKDALKERHILSDPFTYAVVDAGKDYKLCLKKPLSGEYKARVKAQCITSVDGKKGDFLWDSTMKDESIATYKRDQFRELANIFIITRLLAYAQAHDGSYPKTLDDLKIEDAGFARTMILDPKKGTPFEYKPTESDKNFELCYNNEESIDGCRDEKGLIKGSVDYKEF
jgi:hypothetical protein